MWKGGGVWTGVYIPLCTGPTRTATETGGTHPIGMHSNFSKYISVLLNLG